MARNNALNFNLPSADDLFSTEEERAEARLEKVVNLSPAEISDFPNHPFKVRMDAAMQEMAEWTGWTAAWRQAGPRSGWRKIGP